MAKWREPITGMSVTPYGDEDCSTPPRCYIEHETDEVFEGYTDAGFFYPRCRLQRHFVDGELKESQRVPLRKGDPRCVPINECAGN